MRTNLLPAGKVSFLPVCQTVIHAFASLLHIVPLSSGLFYSTGLTNKYTDRKTGLLVEPLCLLSADALKKLLHSVCPWKWGLFARSEECLCTVISLRKRNEKILLCSASSLSLVSLFFFSSGSWSEHNRRQPHKQVHWGQLLSLMAVTHLHKRSIYTVHLVGLFNGSCEGTEEV